jgi:hypothetical protein
VKPSSKITFNTIAQLLLSGLGFLNALVFTVLMAAFGLLTAFTGGIEGGGEAYGLLSLAWTGGAFSLLLVPMLCNVVLVLLGKPRLSWRPQQGFRLATFGLLAWPFLFLLGYLLSSQPAWELIILPPLQILVIGIPLWWLVELGMRFLKVERVSREWPVVGFSLLVTPLVVIVVELVIVLAALVVFIVWAASQPAVLAQIQQLSLRLMNAPADMEILQRIMQPYFQQPGVILAILALAAGLVPLLEEMFKPMAVWLLISRKITPREGFAMGMLAGAVFGLLESLGALAAPLGDGWYILVIGRLGTCLLHTVTSALVGWGIAEAWTQRRVLRLFGAYLAAVALHAVWNAFALLMGIFPAMTPVQGTDNWFSALAEAAPFILAFLAAGMLVVFIASSRKIGGQELSAAAQEIGLQ